MLDYEMWREPAPADNQPLFGRLSRVRDMAGRQVGAVATDGRFASAANCRALSESDAFDALRPRPPAELSRRRQDQQFARLQRRRARTEGRIGVLKQGFLGRPMRGRGFAHRELAPAWGVWRHNLGMRARLKKIKKKTKHEAVPLRKAASVSAGGGGLTGRACL